MTHCCSQCNFTAHFESALLMHRQLHHYAPGNERGLKKPVVSKSKSNTLPRPVEHMLTHKESKEPKLLCRTSSATKIFNKIRARISRSKTLFSHPEETTDNLNDLSPTSGGMSDCTSKTFASSHLTNTSHLHDSQETFACHLCTFDADRITVLDRHLLNNHQIGLDNLMKLVMAKTKEGLADEPTKALYGIRQPYYKIPNELIEEGEFIIETVSPKIKVLKHASTNTDINDMSCKISEELERMRQGLDKCDKNELLDKIQVLNEYMCKYVDSSKTIKNVLTKKLESKHSVRTSRMRDESLFSLGLGDQESPRDWGRCHSEKMERVRHKHGESCSRGEKSKVFSDSFYF